MSSYPFIRFATLSITALLPTMAAVAQSSVAVSPFVSYVPSANQNPFAGLSLTFGGTTGLALRAGADLSIENPSATNDATGAATPGGYRPWSADADAILFLGGLGGGATVFRRTLSPYLFAGLGLNGGDSAGINVVRNGWSYGAGAAIPLGLHADLFGEARWRMPEYVLPTSQGAPESKSELRFGISFHVGGPSETDSPPRRRGRHRYDRDHVYEDHAPQTVTVVPVAPPPPPPQTQINIVIPAVVVTPSRQSSHHVTINRVRVVHPVVRVSRSRVITTRRGRPSASANPNCSETTTAARGARRPARGTVASSPRAPENACARRR